MRFFICADIEGVAGVSSREQLRPEGGVEHQRARELFTAEVAVVADRLLAAGASEVVIADSHGNAQNLLIEKLPRRARLVRAWPRPLDMMQGIEEGRYEGVFFVGHHAGAHHLGGVCAHTYSSRHFTRVAINGEPVSETRVNSALAAHFGAPTLFASGDDIYCAHVRDFLPATVTVETKRSLGLYAAVMRHPHEVQADLAAGVEAALSKRSDIAPIPIAGEITLGVSFTNRLAPELLAYLSMVERVDSHTIEARFADLPAAVRFLHFLQAYPMAMA